MSDDTKRDRDAAPPPGPAGDDTAQEDEGRDGLGYTARPTHHEPEGDNAPAGGGGDATRK